MAIHTVLFDMDGVLIDVSGSFHRAIEETAAAFIGRPVPPGRIREYKNRGGFNDDWKLTHALVSDAGVAASFEEVVAAFQQRYRGAAWDGYIAEEPALIRPEALEALRAAGMALGVVTGRPRAEALWTIEKQGWSAYFPVVNAMEDQAGRGKPDPYGLRCAMEALGPGARPETTAYIGDTVDDMTAARAAGAWAIGITPPYLDHAGRRALLQAHGAHHVVSACSDLPALLAALEGAPG